MPWKMIFVRSRGAMTVLATAPAKAPHSRDSRAVEMGLKSCLDTTTRYCHVTVDSQSRYRDTNRPLKDNSGYLYDLKRN